MPSIRDRLRLVTRAVQGLFSDASLTEAYHLLVGILPGARGDPPARSDSDFLLGYANLPWLRACAHKIAIATAAVPWELYAPRRARNAKAIHRQLAGLEMVPRHKLLMQLKQTEDVRPILDHPFLDVLDKPNNFLTGLVLKRLTQTYIDLVGEVFWLKERNGLGLPSQLWPIPPHWVIATPTPTHRFYRVAFRAWIGEIPDSEMLWIKDPAPWNPYSRGSGTGQSLADELETDEYVSKFIKTYFYQGGRPDMIVTAEGLEPEETRRLETDWNTKHQGFWRAFKTHFLNRKVDITQIPQNFEHLQLKDLRTHERDIIIQAFGIPPELIGLLQSSNRATAQMAESLFSRWVLIPRLELQRASLQEHLLPEWDDRLILDYTSPVPEDATHILEAAKAAPWSLSIDEWRALQGLPALGNGAGAIHMVPFTLQPQQFQPSQGIPGSQLASPPPILRHASPLVSPQKTADEQAVLAALAGGLEAELHRVFLAAMRERRTALDVPAVASALVTGDATRLAASLDWDGFAAALTLLLTPWTQGVLRSGMVAGETLTATLDLPTPFLPTGTDAELMQQRTQHYGGQLINSLTDASQAGVAAIIARGQEERWPAADLAQAIRTVLGLTAIQALAVNQRREQLLDAGVEEHAVADQIEQYSQELLDQRAVLVARTESQRAIHLGRQLTWEVAVLTGVLNGETTVKRWVTADAPCAAVCAPMPNLIENQRVPIAGWFLTGSGEKVSEPPTHPNCQCHVELVLEGAHG